MPFGFDYVSYRDDTYAQVRIEELLGKKYGLFSYRQEKGSRFPEREDYIFVCVPDKETEIAEMLTEIFFTETKFSIGGCLYCRVNNEAREQVFSYHHWTISSQLVNQQGREITEENVYEYILEELREGMKAEEEIGKQGR